MLTIWGRTNSINVMKVLWACDEVGVPYQRIDAGMQFGVVDTPEYAHMNPNRRVPTINDDGFVLWESSAIWLRAMAAKICCPAHLKHVPMLNAGWTGRPRASRLA
jgi:glutathione S-transferase